MLVLIIDGFDGRVRGAERHRSDFCLVARAMITHAKRLLSIAYFYKGQARLLSAPSAVRLPVVHINEMKLFATLLVDKAIRVIANYIHPSQWQVYAILSSSNPACRRP